MKCFKRAKSDPVPTVKLFNGMRDYCLDLSPIDFRNALVQNQEKGVIYEENNVQSIHVTIFVGSQGFNVTPKDLPSQVSTRILGGFCNGRYIMNADGSVRSVVFFVPENEIPEATSTFAILNMTPPATLTPNELAGVIQGLVYLHAISVLDLLPTYLPKTALTISQLIPPFVSAVNWLGEGPLVDTLADCVVVADCGQAVELVDKVEQVCKALSPVISQQLCLHLMTRSVSAGQREMKGQNGVVTRRQLLLQHLLWHSVLAYSCLGDCGSHTHSAMESATAQQIESGLLQPMLYYCEVLQQHERAERAHRFAALCSSHWCSCRNNVVQALLNHPAVTCKAPLLMKAGTKEVIVFKEGASHARFAMKLRIPSSTSVSGFSIGGDTSTVSSSSQAFWVNLEEYMHAFQLRVSNVHSFDCLKLSLHSLGKCPPIHVTIGLMQQACVPVLDSEEPSSAWHMSQESGKRLTSSVAQCTQTGSSNVHSVAVQLPNDDLNVDSLEPWFKHVPPQSQDVHRFCYDKHDWGEMVVVWAEVHVCSHAHAV